MIFFLIWQIQQDTISHDTVNIITYQAKQITFDLERSIVVLNDSALIAYQDVVLHADSAYYFIDEDRLHAFGLCRLQQADDSIKGSFLKYNVESKKALMENGSTQMEKGYMRGERIFWISENTVNAYNGTYTTCSDSPPHYFFYSPKMKVFIGDMVIARPIYLYIYDLPVLAAPFWFVPISSKRKSGLLPFKAGSSRQYGKYLRGFAYYQVISDYADVTIQTDAYEKKGIMPQVEGVWDFSPFSAGSVLGSYIKETDRNRVRYRIAGRNNSAVFLLGSSFNCDVKYSSDNALSSDYAETTAVWLEREIISQATINRSLADIKNTLSMERKIVFLGDTVYDRLPHYTVSMPAHSFLSLISYSLSGHVNRDRVASGDSADAVSGANIHLNPTLQQNILGFFNVSPGMDLDLAVFDEDSSGRRFPARFGYSLVSGMNTILFRRFPLAILGVHGILHKVIPTVRYTYTPDFDFRGLPTVSGIPQYSRNHYLDFGVGQEFEAKVGEKNDKRNFLKVDVNSGLNLITDSLRPVSFAVNLPLNPFPKPIAGFANRLEGSYDLYHQDYTYTFSNNLSVRTDIFSLALNQSYTKGGVYQCWFSGDVKPSRNWQLAFSGRYDYATKRLVDYSLGFTRNMHCWEGVFNFSQLGSDWRYDFKVRIKEIPEIQIGRGLLGYLLE